MYQKIQRNKLVLCTYLSMVLLTDNIFQIFFIAISSDL
jgi:hypothetical protein